MKICDAHCHFFSSRYLELLTKGRNEFPDDDRATAVAKQLGWDPPGSVDSLADRWITEMARNGVSRSALIASIPGDEVSVAEAVAKHPTHFVGFFMFNPDAPDAAATLERALGEHKLRAVALFPAMFSNQLRNANGLKTFEAAAARGAAVFVHCGALTVGVRKKLGLPSRFDIRYGNPLQIAGLATQFPTVPVIIPHFGAGMLREALMVADQAPNVYFDTSSSNGWIKYYPGLTLEAVFKTVLSVVGPDRLLFGTDSSFFPRGWQRPIFDAQSAVLSALDVSDDHRARIMGGNFERLFPSA